MKDHNGISPAEVIGRIFLADEGMPEPSGFVLDAQIDGVGVMMLTIQTNEGELVDMVPLTLGKLLDAPGST